MKKISLLLLIFFYLIAGINHFVLPDFYLPLIPYYLPYPIILNALSGVLEILFGILLIFPSSRKVGSYGIVLMLIAFIPSHLYFINNGNCFDGFFCISAIVSWFRLIIVHPLLIYWAWTAQNNTSKLWK